MYDDLIEMVTKITDYALRVGEDKFTIDGLRKFTELEVSEFVDRYGAESEFVS